jgi:amino acid transporter
MSSVVFARKASGLTREASLWDAVLFAIADFGGAVGIWYYHLAYYTFPGVIHVFTILLGGVLLILGPAIAFGILAAAMPRSGGIYVYNTRTLHPAIGMTFSFLKACGSVAWLSVLTPWIANPGLRIFAGCVGLSPDAVAWASEPWGIYLVATICVVIGYVILIAGMRTYFRVQMALMLWNLIAVAICGIVFSMYSHDAFVSAWNTIATKCGAPTWSEVFNLVPPEYSNPQPSVISSLGAILPLTWVVLYIATVTFIGGEVKNPRRNLFLSFIISAVLYLVLTLWVTIGLERIVGYDGAHVLSYIDNEGPDWYTMPFSPMYLNIASLLVGIGSPLSYFLGLSFLLGNFMWVFTCTIAFSRALFAWGMDQLGPTWFTDVNPKVSQPLKLLLLMFILSQIGIIGYAVTGKPLVSFGVEIMDIVAYLFVTMIGAIVFPYRKSIKHIWETSPHKNWKILGVPVAVISGIIGIIYGIINLWAAYYSEGLEAFRVVFSASVLGAIIAGVAWYYIWKWYRAKQGIDVTLAFKELAPE